MTDDVDLDEVRLVEPSRIERCDPRDWYWYVAGDRERVFSSVRNVFVSLDDAAFMGWSAVAGRIVSTTPSMDDLVGVLRAHEVAPYRKIRKSTVIARLTDAQLDAAMEMMSRRQKERWRAPDWPMINTDDPELLAVITAVGANPETVLASD